MQNDETNSDLIVRVAWLHYVAGHTQEKIASRLGLSKPRVNRLIAAAHREGLIRVFIERAPDTCLHMAEQLCSRFGLINAEVVPADIDRSGADEHQAAAGAAFLKNYLDKNDAAIIGFGHGRTLAKIVDRLPGMSKPKVRLVSLLGSLTRRASANPLDVVYRLAERTGAEGFVLPIPLVADTDQDRDILLSQNSVRQIIDLAHKVDMVMIGVGDLGPDSYWAVTGILSEDERLELRHLGAVGNMLGRFLDAEGHVISTPATDRFLCIDPSEFQGVEIVAVGGGKRKGAILAACLKTGKITHLITDEDAARDLLSN
jgi:DNA-binding transcriptional regulator LsrR (DeoR family)